MKLRSLKKRIQSKLGRGVLIELRLPEDLAAHLRHMHPASRERVVIQALQKYMLKRRSMAQVPAAPTPTSRADEVPTSCGCHACSQGVTVGGLPLSATRMILCPECGNKRCPRANDHRNACTNSNEPGQAGSAYA